MSFEELSALMDGELPARQTEQVLDRVLDDESLRAAWRRMALAGAILRRKREPVTDIADAVMARIEQDDLEHAKVHWLFRPQQRRWRAGLGVAMAAGLAAVAVSLVPINAFRSGVEDGIMRSSMSIAQTSAIDAGTGVTHWSQVDQDTEEQLNRYLLDHSNVTVGYGLGTQRGYLRVASYNAENSR